MSGLAEVLLGRLFPVSGSDSHESELTKRLTSKGAQVYYGQRAENIDDSVKVVVYTAAIRPDNPELMEAERRGLPLLTRAELLGQLMRNYPVAAAVSGTHGKTTTTSMLAEILMKEDLDPTISVGGMLDSIGGNIRVGRSGVFLTEACEYTNSFLSFFPTLAIILNIRADHLDFFKDLEDIRHSFRKFAELLPKDGLLVISSAIENVEEITAGLACKVALVGDRASDDYQIEDISFGREGNGSFTLRTRSLDHRIRIDLRVPGSHNVLNAAAAAAAALEMGVSENSVIAGLDAFHGTHRRFEFKGMLGRVKIVDDYAHHPDEIEATLRTAGTVNAKRVVCVFQPHTYSRTKALLNEFVQALSLADVVILAEIYPARETDTLGVHSSQIVEKLVQMGKEAYYFSTFEEIEKFILKNSIDGDLLITMGAGNVVNIGENLLKG